MAMNSEYRGSASGAVAAKKKSATKSKTVVTPGTKVSQKTIDNIKSMGMSKTLEALKSIGQPGGRNVPASKEFIEGARRMYGSRVDKYLPAKSTSADAARRSASGAKPATKAAIKAVSTKAAPKKGQSTADKLKVVGGTVAAVALAAKGGSAGRSAAAKLAPGLAKSGVGRALFGTAPKASPAMMAKIKAGQSIGESPVGKVAFGKKGSFGPTTKTMAKSKLGTPSEYALKAGQERARSQIKVSGPDAARAAADKVTVGKKGSFGKTTLTKKKAASTSMASNKRK